MEKLPFGEELRALFREIFKIEIKNVTKDIAFFGKLGGTKLNQERLSSEKREWLQNIGVLTSDERNSKNVDDRSIFSHIISAVYAGIYGLNFVDVTAHCLSTIKKEKGLKQNQNLVDFLSPMEVRQFSVALHTLSNNLKQMKNKGMLSQATMNNFYIVANKAFNAGLASRSAVIDANSEFQETKVRHKASNTINNINQSIQLGNFSHKKMQLANCDNENLKSKKQAYRQTEQQIKDLLKEQGLSQGEIENVLACIDEGYYKSKYFRIHKNSISRLICRDDAKMSACDIDWQYIKISYAKLALEDYCRQTQSQEVDLRNILNIAYKSGNNARIDCMCKTKTSPEYFSSFAGALILDKEYDFGK